MPLRGKISSAARLPRMTTANQQLTNSCGFSVRFRENRDQPSKIGAVTSNEVLLSRVGDRALTP
ncbi:hypothetical protein D3C73_1581800 [compost metagenome]